MTDVPVPEAADPLVAVGRVGPARGVRGETFVEPWTDTPTERFAAGAVLLTEPAEAGPLTVAASVLSSGRLVVHFEGVTDRASAEALRGVEVFVRASDRAPIADPDEFYDTDLVGLLACTVDGAELGPVRDVVHAAGASYLVVHLGGRDHLVPFVTAVVPTVDVSGGRLVVDPPQGLFEL